VGLSTFSEVSPNKESEEKTMNEKVKILIAYDGSEQAEAALTDLKRAGLPRKAQAVILSVAEEWFPAPSSIGGVETSFPKETFKAEQEALKLARSARAVIKTLFPDWEVHAESAIGSPAERLMWKAEEWHPDLIVVGSQGRSGLGRFFFGSVSQRILHQAHCSVRVARGQAKGADKPVRLIVGVDGSKDAAAAVKAITARHWPQGSEARVINASWPVPAVTSDEMAVRVEQWVAAENARIRKMVETAAQSLQGINLLTSIVVKEDDPKHLLCAEAERWGADCIFLGAKGIGHIERLVLGSVSSAVAARAHCSVEVVRTDQPN
jgi:nucleotide-binding universal stress UspA family protein